MALLDWCKVRMVMLRIKNLSNTARFLSSSNATNSHTLDVLDKIIISFCEHEITHGIANMTIHRTDRVVKSDHVSTPQLKQVACKL